MGVGNGSAPSDAGAVETGAGPAADGGSGLFSFFVTSLRAMQRLSGSQAGFGGDLRFGQPDGLTGADEICRQIAETSMPGSGAKGWRAFLSVTKGPDGQPVHAIDRVGEGPWYDRLGRLVAKNKADLVQTRPKGDPLIVNDLPNEDGVPNHAPDGQKVDNHDILTGSDAKGRLYSTDWSATCHDWTSKVGSDGQPRVGHSWPRRFGPGFPAAAPPKAGYRCSTKPGARRASAWSRWVHPIRRTRRSVPAAVMAASIASPCRHDVTELLTVRVGRGPPAIC